MFPLKLILTTQKLRIMRINFIVFSLVLSVLNAFAEDIELPEVQTLDYEFMNKIAEYVKTTDHLSIYGEIYPDSKPIKPGQGYYDMHIEPINEFNERRQVSGDLQFDNYKSYVINVVYTQSCYGSPSIFYIHDVPFYTNFNLIPYFQSCKVRKKLCHFMASNWSWERFWKFVIIKGKLTKAFYYYEKDELDLDNNLVYDIINKKYIRHKDWRSR